MHNTGTIFCGNKITQNNTERLCTGVISCIFSRLFVLKVTGIRSWHFSSSCTLNQLKWFIRNILCRLLQASKITIFAFRFQVFANKWFCQDDTVDEYRDWNVCTSAYSIFVPTVNPKFEGIGVGSMPSGKYSIKHCQFSTLLSNN